MCACCVGEHLVQPFVELIFREIENKRKVEMETNVQILMFILGKFNNYLLKTTSVQRPHSN